MLRRTTCLLVAVLLSGCAVDVASDPSLSDEAVSEAIRVCSSGETVQGVDVSKWQGTVDWAKVYGAGKRFAFIRVSDGAHYKDPKFASNWQGAKAAGLYRGVYQYFRASQDATTQANLLADAVGWLGSGDLPAVLDVEELDGQSARTVASGIRTWLGIVARRTGRTPIVYTGRYFWDTELGAPSGFEAHPLWVANYGVSCPSVPTGWKNWDFWQFSSAGTVKGISGGVDVNVFQGSLSELGALAGVQTSVPASVHSSAIETVRVTASLLNLRRGPSTAYSVLATLPCGKQLQVLDKVDGGWLKVRVDGVEGYCHGGYTVSERSYSTAVCSK